MRIAIFKKENDSALEAYALLKKECEKRNIIEDENNPEYVFVLGGDGTFLKVVHQYMDKLDQVTFIGIRCGTLGYFYDFNKEDIASIFDLVDQKEFIIKKQNLLECHLNEKVLYAVNEIRFESPFHTLTCEVKINNQLMELYRGTGLLVCSELGSTAYNKSLGGAILSLNNELMQLTEISSIQNNAYRSLDSSLVVDKKARFSFTGNFDNVVVGYDYLCTDAKGVKDIIVEFSNKSISVLYSKNYSHLEHLRRSFIE